MEEAEEWIVDIQGIIIKNNVAEKKSKRKLLGHGYRLRELSDSTKCNNIHIIGVSEEEEWGKRAEGLSEQTIAENFPNADKKTGI